MEAGEQAVDDSDAALRRDHEIGPAAGRDHVAGAIGRRLERAHDGRADGDDAVAALFGTAHFVRGAQRHLEVLLVRTLVRLETRDARVQHELREADTAAAQADEHAACERASGRRHLRRTRRVGVDGLICVDAEVAVDVRVGDRAAEAHQVLAQVRNVDACDP